jgi:hypothetical protein
MRKVAYLAVALTAVLFISVCLTSVALYALTRPTHRVIHTWQQPNDLQYDAFTYYLSVVESDRDWRGFPLYVARRHYIYVGRESGQPTHGHVIDFSFYPFPDKIDDHIRQSTTTWTADGVTFQPPSGHSLFIPERMFTGGR